MPVAHAGMVHHINTAPVGLRKKYLDGEKGGAPPKPRREFTPSNHLDSVLSSVVIPGPDIEWNPSFETYQARVEALSKTNSSRPKTVPEAWPQVVDAPWAWSTKDFEDESKFIVFLNEEEIAEVNRALDFFNGLPGKLGPGEVSRETFPLPNLQKKLQGVARNLHLGFGFNVIRGLEPQRYTPLDNVIIYLGITSYIAEHRGVQDSGGSMIIHVKDLGRQIPHSEMRQSPYARNAQPFHNDVCDILAMYVQQQAAEGGESYLAAGATVYNEIAATRPDVIHTLADTSWVFDKHRTPAYWNNRAILFNFSGYGPGFCFSRRPITGSPTSPRSPGVPPMTEVQAEALDMVHFTAVKHQISMRLQRGDIQLINNLAVFHARNGFRDKIGEQRHIIRLWLRNEELAWKTPEGLKRTWFEKYGESERRKIAKWNIEPGASRERVIYRSDSCS
ncbi:Clavaminate synthase-like protein [Lepidopterella palustris CBS 459.81]|uniref:Clavaminate synthase-like protein n=1 Tax=Lepidopterella palustris CBS 459.81 TaxID=1314670 RepID=A0A8E2JEB4_9PEZI|nr:Clavaminate synthase-like protein [Lepidopterella palustris CBS 459.81]